MFGSRVGENMEWVVIRLATSPLFNRRTEAIVISTIVMVSRSSIGIYKVLQSLPQFPSRLQTLRAMHFGSKLWFPRVRVLLSGVF